MAETNDQDVPVPLAEKLKGLTGFFGIRLVEQPEYYILRSDGEKEVRKYHPMMMASVIVPVESGLQKARENAFMNLAAYIFGRNETSLHIPMTAPVLEEHHCSKRDLKLPVSERLQTGVLMMSFILPINYGPENTPSPLDSRIILHRKPTHKLASIAYSGHNDSEKLQAKEAELRNWVRGFPNYRTQEEVVVAQYDGPSTPAFLRKNEIHIEIRCVI